MDTPYTGLTASVEAAGEVIAYISGVDLNLDKDIIEIIAFGKQYKEKVPAIKDWSASIDGTVALTSGGSQEALYEAFENDTKLTIGIFLNDNNYFEGQAFVSSFNISAAPDDKIELTSELAGTDAVVLTLAGVSSRTTLSSKVYLIDNKKLTIVNVPLDTLVADFEANLVPATGATILGDYVGTDVATGDTVEVTAEDTTTTRTYVITVTAIA